MGLTFHIGLSNKRCHTVHISFAMHVPEFLHLYGNVVMFSQQGLEKLNDLTTKHFQRASNHREYDALKQVLEKRNRLELLEDTASQRTKRVQTCSICKLTDHNRRSCPNRPPLCKTNTANSVTPLNCEQ